MNDRGGSWLGRRLGPSDILNPEISVLTIKDFRDDLKINPLRKMG
jgi:hypothetical protein